MHKLWIAAGLLIAVSLVTPAFAACPQGTACPKTGMQRMVEDLNLSPAQQEQIRKIHSDARLERSSYHDALLANRDAVGRLDPAAADYTARMDLLAAEKGKTVEAMMKVYARENAAVTAVLSFDQRLRRAELHAERQAGRDGKVEGDVPQDK